MKTGKALSNMDQIAEPVMASRIANEFQTPLGIIISASELLESYFERLTPERRQVALEDILCAARQMNSAMDLLSVFETDKNSKSAPAMPIHRGRIRKVHSARKTIRSAV
jgi:signal transduction histidine kinase